MGEAAKCSTAGSWHSPLLSHIHLRSWGKGWWWEEVTYIIFGVKRNKGNENPTQLCSLPLLLSLMKRTPLLSPPCCPLRSCNPTGKSGGWQKTGAAK